MQETPGANRPHISVFGRRNAGKSSLINALTNQDLALVSEIPGTTADPVYKRMELLPLGPVVMIDTAGIDDTGSLGELRVEKTLEVIRRTDLAILVLDVEIGFDSWEKKMLNKLKSNEVPAVIAVNKIDKSDNYGQVVERIKEKIDNDVVPVSAGDCRGIEDLRDRIAENTPGDFERSFIVGDLINPGELVVLVTPIDLAAPKGRLILPQVQTMRDVLDHDGMTMVTKERELKFSLDKLKDDPALVVTDSQVFKKVDADVPGRVPMTSFSILFARYKGDLNIFLNGCRKLEKLKIGDRILIAEACTHRRQADDIGTVKLPRWLREHVEGDLKFDTVSGRQYPDNLNEYDLILHCGACMINRKEVLARLREAEETGIPVVNYGMAIAYLHGILDRALKPLELEFRR